MKQLRTGAATTGFKCGICKEQVFPCEQGIFVEIDGNPVRGGRYCDCHDVEDVLMEHPGTIHKTSEDNRWFVSTPDGKRAGAEWTGHRCEDAPCCGCCD